MIEVKHLSKQYGAHLAVGDVSFTLEDGKIYGLLGPNGAGKSTTMNMMTGYISITAGEVRVDGHDLSTEPEQAKRCIGYLPEIPPLYPEMTIQEYLQSVAEMKKLPVRERRGAVEDAMERVGVTSMGSRLIRNLSKGYKQRVGIAQTLLGDPGTIILDEPTVGLDPRQILDIRALIADLKQRHTVILSSHILSEISAVCDEVLIIRGGRLIAAGSVRELEERAAGSRHLSLQVEASEEVVQSVLGELNLAQAAQVTPVVSSTDEGGRYGAAGEDGEAVEQAEGEPKLQQIELEIGAQEDPRRELFFAFAKRGCAILEMGYENLSLEDAFLKLTANENVRIMAERRRR